MALSALAASGQVTFSKDLTELSLDELASVSISAASKHSQPLFETPAAVTVLLSDEIRRYGFSSVADALRIVPGVHVAETDTNHWSVGVRGFNGLTSTKLLVLVDGQNLYSPLYGSVGWDQSTVPMEDLDRIEVVRGPGSSVWGANAVNGIVSIVSKDAQNTQGTLASLRWGSEDGLEAYFRYGGRLGQHTWYRVFIRETNTDLDADAWSKTPHSDVQDILYGFRADQEFNDALHLTWQFGGYSQRTTTAFADQTTGTVRHGHIGQELLNALGRLKWQGDLGRELTIQTYFNYRDQTANSSSYAGFGGQMFGAGEDGHTFDLDVSHRFPLGSHDIVWGGGYRNNLIDVDTSGQLLMSQPHVIQARYNFFVQDDIAVVPEKLRLSLGTKLEHHEIVGWQVLPTARLTYTPSPQQTWWAAVSRSIRAPSRIEEDVRLSVANYPATPTSPAVRVDYVADGTMREEVLLAYEAGWRWSPNPRASLDVSAYYNDYDRLRDLRASSHFELTPPTFVNDLILINQTRAHGYGTELSAQWRPNDRFRLAATYTWQYLAPTTAVTDPVIMEDLAVPQQLWSIRGWVELTRDVELSSALFYVADVPNVSVQSYYRFDTQLTWRPRVSIELNLGIQNAFETAHREFGSLSVMPSTDVPRKVYFRAQWRF